MAHPASPALWLAVIAGACTGQIDGEKSSEGDDVPPPPATSDRAPRECTVRGAIFPGRTPLRRLTRIEYNNTVRDLLGDTSGPAWTFPPEEETAGFLNNADAYTTTDLHAEAYTDAAEKLATTARGSGKFKLGCAANVESCAKGFIRDFGLKAFRQPLQDADIDSYYARFMAGALGDGGFEEGLEWVVGRMLQAPRFLYRVETDGEGTVLDKPVPLSGYSVASRLSYFLWQTMPDDALFTAAAGGKLDTVNGIAVEVDRMLKDAKFAAALSSFHQQWLHTGNLLQLAKVKTITPAWDDMLKGALLREFDLFVKDVFDSGGTLGQLLTAESSYVNPLLARYYKMSPPAGTDFARVDKMANRSGVLTMPAFLAVHAHPDQSSPVRRGEAIRKQFLCTDPPPPPANLKVVVPAVTPGVSTRERFEKHRTEPSCATCHTLMDPLGMPLENYDEFGRWRTVDGGKVIDPRGELIATSAAEPLVSSAKELGEKLGALPETGECVVKQWFRYAAGHSEEAADACTITGLFERFGGSKQNLRDLLVGITTSQGFRYRVNPSAANGGAPVPKGM